MRLFVSKIPIQRRFQCPYDPLNYGRFGLVLRVIKSCTSLFLNSLPLSDLIDRGFRSDKMTQCFYDTLCSFVLQRLNPQEFRKDVDDDE